MWTSLKHTQNTCCFSTETMDTQTRLASMLYVHCVSCCYMKLTNPDHLHIKIKSCKCTSVRWRKVRATHLFSFVPEALILPMINYASVSYPQSPASRTQIAVFRKGPATIPVTPNPLRIGLFCSIVCVVQCCTHPLFISVATAELV
jgi:hypothetical protein